MSMPIGMRNHFLNTMPSHERRRPYALEVELEELPSDAIDARSIDRRLVDD